MADIRLITLEPGHFHAALVQKEMYPGVSPRAHVYARLGPDLLAHLARIAAFNGRPAEAAPTHWELEVHASDEPLARLLAERPGNVVILSGQNRDKIRAILAAVEAGLHVLADKPWVIRPEDLPLLRQALEVAQQKRLVALDIMTERHEATTRLQRELIRDPAVFGQPEPGSLERPGVRMESRHFLCKTVAGAPLRRPAWFFDVTIQGEGLADVGTHLVDLAPWMLFPGRPIGLDDLRLLRAVRTPTFVSRADFQRITGEPDFPASLGGLVAAEGLPYYCNTELSYELLGVHVRLDIGWGVASLPGAGDTHLAQYRGTRSVIEVRQGAAEQFRPEVYVAPHAAAELPAIAAAVRQRLAAVAVEFPGVGVEQQEGRLRLTIPGELRTGHESHFAAVARQFFAYLDDPSLLPAWEQANMLAKYHVTTHGVRLAGG